YWSAQPGPPAADDTEQVLVRGAVLVRIRGRHRTRASGTRRSPAPLSPELAAALAAPASWPGRTFLRLLAGSGAVWPIGLAVGLVMTAVGSVLEALLFRGLLDLGRELPLLQQRLLAIACF